MKINLYNLRISVGRPKSFLIPDNVFNDFYSYVTHSIFDNTDFQPQVSTLNIPIEPPITPQWKVLNNHLLSFFEKLNDSSNIYVFIHILDVIKTTDYFQILSLYDEVKSKVEKLNVKTIFFIERDIKKEDYLLSLPFFLSKVGVLKEFVILNEDGKYTFSESEKKEIPEFKNRIYTTKVTFEDRLKLKLIRKIGHFIKEKDGKHILCQKYFFDGIHCKKEITHLLYEQITSEINTTKSFGIYIHCTNWAASCFHEIFEMLKKEFGHLCFEKMLTDEFDKVEQVILLTDVVVSGNTL